MTKFLTNACVLLLILCNTAAFAAQNPRKKKGAPAKQNCLSAEEYEQKLDILLIVTLLGGAITPKESAQKMRELKASACKGVKLSSVYDGSADKHYADSSTETPTSSEELLPLGLRAS